MSTTPGQSSELLTVVLTSGSATEEEKRQAKMLYQDIVFIGFSWQRNGRVDEIARQEDEEVRERMDEKESFVMTKKEYQEMIDRLVEQMHLSAQSEEYYRLAMIKDRIAELRAEMEHPRHIRQENGEEDWNNE
ncbi:MAG: hypothetical protein KGI50_01760 [Patescibacteria group bacterium]|nr:hypothetical protein [Patescibacteria group bacterium]MDE2437930.1 hypothetical protein [Patescibacteria group bacterium]